MNDNSSRVVEVDINEILPNRFQPRIQFDEEEILELSDSIKEHGVIQPIVVRTIGDKYEIIAGERRYKASVLAGKDTVPVIVKNLNDKESAEVALIENIQRKNLTPIEEALSYKKILDMGYITQDKLASKLGKSQSSVANKIRLLNLSDEVQEALLENKISERHARSLLKLSTSLLQNEMLSRIINERLTVRRTDEEIEKIKNLNTDLYKENNEYEIREEGEINMNNNVIGTPVVPQNSPAMPSFDVFGSSTPTTPEVAPAMEPIAPVAPAMEPIAPVAPAVEPIAPVAPAMEPIAPVAPAMEPIAPVAPAMEPIAPVAPAVEPIAPVAPAMEPIAPVAPAVEPIAPVAPAMEPIAPVAPAVEPIAPVAPSAPEAPTVGFQFDANGNVISTSAPAPETTAPAVEPIAPVAPSAPEAPTVGFQFDANGNVISTSAPAPETTAPAVEPIAPVAPSAPEAPTVGFQFDANGNVISTSAPAPETTVPAMEPTAPVASPIPEISPIIENTNVQEINDNLYSFTPIEDANTNNVATQPAEIKVPEPIIVTDYSKQYDPVMPQTTPVAQQKVDFREVINAIRECSRKIEQYGYIIDLEEYDLENLYQVVFKINK